LEKDSSNRKSSNIQREISKPHGSTSRQTSGSSTYQKPNQNFIPEAAEDVGSTKVKLMVDSMLLTMPIARDVNRKIVFELAEFNLFVWPGELIHLVTSKRHTNLYSNGFVMESNKVSDSDTVNLKRWNKSVIDIAIDSFGASLFEAGNLESTLLAPTNANVKIHSVKIFDEYRTNLNVGVLNIDAYLADIHLFVGVAQLRTILDAFRFSYEAGEAPVERDPSTGVRFLLI
jgi:hypothetical protein